MDTQAQQQGSLPCKEFNGVFACCRVAVDSRRRTICMWDVLNPPALGQDLGGQGIELCAGVLDFPYREFLLDYCINPSCAKAVILSQEATRREVSVWSMSETHALIMKWSHDFLKQATKLDLNSSGTMVVTNQWARNESAITVWDITHASADSSPNVEASSTSDWYPPILWQVGPGRITASFTINPNADCLLVCCNVVNHHLEFWSTESGMDERKLIRAICAFRANGMMEMITSRKHCLVAAYGRYELGVWRYDTGENLLRDVGCSAFCFGDGAESAEDPLFFVCSKDNRGNHNILVWRLNHHPTAAGATARAEQIFAVSVDTLFTGIAYFETPNERGDGFERRFVAASFRNLVFYSIMMPPEEQQQQPEKTPKKKRNVNKVAQPMVQLDRIVPHPELLIGETRLIQYQSPQVVLL